MIEAQLTGLITTHTHNYQPVDNDLIAIAALTGISGLLKKTAADTWALDLNLLSDGYSVGIGANAPLSSKLQVAQIAAGPGTVSVSGTTVTGVGTNFTNLFKVGDTINVVTSAGSETKAITAIASDTALTTAAFTGTAASGIAYSTVAGDRFTVKGNGNTESYGSVTARSSFNLKNAAGVTKWSLQVDSSDNLQFLNASGVVEAVLDQSGNLKAKGEVYAYATI